MTDDELNALIDTDPFKALCHLVKESGLTMTLYGKPASEEAIRAHVEELVDAKLVLLGTRMGKESNAK